MTEEVRTVFEGKHLLVRERDGWQFVERKNGKSAVAVLACTEDGNVILTEQYRRPVDARVIDFAAGLVGDESQGEEPGETARRELEEETGYTCRSVEHLANAPTSPGITSETVAFYRAVGVRHSGRGGGVGAENIDVHVIALSELPRWLNEQQRSGKLIDLKVWSGLYFLKSSE